MKEKQSYVFLERKVQMALCHAQAICSDKTVRTVVYTNKEAAVTA